MAIARTQQKSYTATKDADSSTHRLPCSVSSFCTPYCPLTALNPRLRDYWPALTLYFVILLLTLQLPVLQVHTGTALCMIFMLKCTKGSLETFWPYFKDTADNSASHPQHTETHAHIHTYVYIYIYVHTQMNVHYCATSGVMDDHIYQPLHSGRIWHKVNF